MMMKVGDEEKDTGENDKNGGYHGMIMMKMTIDHKRD